MLTDWPFKLFVLLANTLSGPIVLHQTKKGEQMNLIMHLITRIYVRAYAKIR